MTQLTKAARMTAKTHGRGNIDVAEAPPNDEPAPMRSFSIDHLNMVALPAMTDLEKLQGVFTAIERLTEDTAIKHLAAVGCDLAAHRWACMDSDLSELDGGTLMEDQA